MKKKIIIIVIAISIVLLIVSVLLLNKKDNKDNKVYKTYKIDNYSFKVLDEYKYKYDKENNRGYLSNKMFVKSYIYLSSKKYKDLISLSAYYEDMGSKEVDSDVEEVKFGDYDALINVKEVEYKDVVEHDYLAIILIKVEEEKTFVFQYEIKAKENKDEILNNIKEGLKNIEEK